MNKKLIIGVATVGLLLGGTTIAAANMNQDEQPIVKVEDNTNKSEVKVDKNELISASEAKEIALAEHDGFVDSVELEYEHGRAYYEVEIETEFNDDVDIYIDANTGEVLAVDEDIKREKQSRKDVMSVEKAKEIAVNELGGKVVEVDLDKDDGRYEYELELRTENGEAEITIDAVTGEILELDID
ncbi:PepSY domain-containing protein [Ornithinibacillus halotolerans]|uniref:PepSY domain-containing protein n=1 Tax=Ornithinibacillus halotolerans TaxID=1274357 RepID=A0A916RT12_9BACI|nr:PepSY domain-containing protein [Ornithinibacillus halotolerans]GGA67609.1 hypothetical protein GCM10008025_09310 [Ornithinibacillus halotolerans]